MYWMRISATFRWKYIKEFTVFSRKIHALKCMFWWLIIGQGGRYTIQPLKQSEAGVSGRWTIQNNFDCTQPICFRSRLRWAGLTHWGRDEMADIFQTTISNAFSLMNMFEFWTQFDWSFYKGLIDNNTPLVQIMTNDYLNQWWPRLMTYIYVIRPQWVNIIHNALYEVRVGSKCPGSCATPPAITIPTSLMMPWPT